MKRLGTLGFKEVNNARKLRSERRNFQAAFFLSSWLLEAHFIFSR
jgi:hypothetical protein